MNLVNTAPALPIKSLMPPKLDSNASRKTRMAATSATTKTMMGAIVATNEIMAGMTVAAITTPIAIKTSSQYPMSISRNLIDAISSPIARTGVHIASGMRSSAELRLLPVVITSAKYLARSITTFMRYPIVRTGTNIE